jgi:predicted metal-dependent hydrolase
MPENAIYAFIEKKYDWILQSQAKISKRHRGQEQVPISGEQRHYLMDCIRKYADKWEPVMGVHCTHWTIQQMKTRWGSCTVSKGTIRINLLLAVKPEECIEYIIVHELTHLLEPSHNQVFKSYMTKFLPDWKERDKLLKTLD